MLQCVISSSDATETKFCRVCHYGYRESKERNEEREKDIAKREEKKQKSCWRRKAKRMKEIKSKI